MNILIFYTYRLPCFLIDFKINFPARFNFTIRRNRVQIEPSKEDKKLEINDFISLYYTPLVENQLLQERIHIEETNRGRGDYQRDYSRILYSSSFRRLQGKMQLLGIQNERFYRNRLTHSLEVSQIARGIAGRLRGLSNGNIYNEDLYVIEAASLAHDIGNPPFGHHGERILNQLIKENGGFEGNAQTLRVLHRLEKKLPNKSGLNLTRRTLLSVVKYFKNETEDNQGKFLYGDDYNLIKKICSETNIKPRTIDVQIMDLADEIAYGAHDLEDALSLHLFSIDEFLYEYEKRALKKSFNDLFEKVKQAYKIAKKASVYESSEEYGFLFRKELISNVVHELILDVDVVKLTEEDKKETGSLNPEELGFGTKRDFAKNLKKVTFECINRSDIVQIYEKQGEKIIKGLFEAFMDDTFNPGNKLLPIEYRGKDKARSVVDYIAGMMDSFAIKVYRDIYGDTALKKIYEPYFFKLYSNI